jgi:hypothetical protein
MPKDQWLKANNRALYGPAYPRPEGLAPELRPKEPADVAG